MIMILLAKVSHIEKMMVQVQCGQDSRLPPVRIFLMCLSMKVFMTGRFSLAGIPAKYIRRCGTWIHIGQADVNIMNCGKFKIERGVCTLSIEEMKNIDVRTVKGEGLADIREVEVNQRKSRDGQIKDYLEQIKNPYCYRYGEYIVKIGFEDTTVTLTDRLRELILKTAGAV